MDRNQFSDIFFCRDAIAAEERAEFERENRLPEETPVKQEVEVLPKRKTRRRAGPYQTRATREENEFENPDNLEITASTSTSTMSDSSANLPDLGSDSDSDDDSSEYSDWIADHGAMLEPPKRSKRKRVPRKLTPSPSPPPRKRISKENKEIKEATEIPVSFFLIYFCPASQFLEQNEDKPIIMCQCFVLYPKFIFKMKKLITWLFFKIV